MASMFDFTSMYRGIKSYGMYNEFLQNPFDRGDCHVVIYAFVLMIGHFLICQIIETTNQNDPCDTLLVQRFDNLTVTFWLSFEPSN